ncbi:MAG: hypothetical protein P8Z30_04600 [Acidobacteriota bacterium]
MLTVATRCEHFVISRLSEEAATEMDITRLIHGKETARSLLPGFSGNALQRLEAVLSKESGQRFFI